MAGYLQCLFPSLKEQMKIGLSIAQLARTLFKKLFSIFLRDRGSETRPNPTRKFWRRYYKCCEPYERTLKASKKSKKDFAIYLIEFYRLCRFLLRLYHCISCLHVCSRRLLKMLGAFNTLSRHLGEKKTCEALKQKISFVPDCFSSSPYLPSGCNEILRSCRQILNPPLKIWIQDLK